jgi:hemolysin activation/secretion protein
VLVVNVEEKPVDAAFRGDNRGTAARGPYQFLAQATINNLLGQHEALTVTYAGVPRLRELQLIAPSFRKVLNSEGLTYFANGSYSWGKPGTVALELLEFETRGLTFESGLTYPIVRTRERNLSVTALAFMSENYSFILRDTFNVDRLRGLRAKAEGDFADGWNGINQISVIVSKGFEGLGSTENGHLNASRSAGRVDFSKVEVYASRLQPLPGRFSALIAAYGQYAFTSLLAPEQCGFGGRQFGRAFDPSELLGDRCWQVSAELRYDIPSTLTLVPNVQLYAFTDKGQADTIAPAVGTASQVSGASAGGGIRLGWQNYFNADLSAAKAVDGPRDDWRFFLVTTARY